ncbi:hypothetical protein [Acinetobacter sp. 161(2023)]|uniref:hypothetical protein n=1 Tax=Acinetobacter sp. 161(2023) TaxID=3098768 RepID=UPI003008BDF8
MKTDNNLLNSSVKQRTPMGLIICYLILGLPASLALGSLIAQLLIINISYFEGRSGYIWIWLFIIVSPFIYFACLITLSILLKKYAKALPTFVAIFGILSVFGLTFFASI